MPAHILRRSTIALIAGLLCTASPRATATGEVTVSGSPRVWHRFTITIQGPATSEQAADNPFRNYRLTARFTHGDRAIDVPGFYAADGSAAETGATAGSAWRVHFTPDAPGRWAYRLSFRHGPDVAMSDEPLAGRGIEGDGASGTFDVAPSDATGRDFRAHGVLRHEGGHHLAFAGTGRPFLKGGADSPENFLAYADFDGTSTSDAPLRPGEAQRALHRYAPHVGDWRPGDPAWRGGKGKGIIGALNYLASRGMNSVYFLTMNVGGDGDDVFPWTSREARDRFDVSKLEQWDVVFSHMTRLGLMLHVVTQETENQSLLDGGALGPLRRLYYRELVARFAYHPAITWNLGEENGEAREGAPANSDEERLAYARWFKSHDPCRHPVVVHTWPGKQERIYRPLLGTPDIDGPSLQIHDVRETYAETRKWRDASARAGRPWFVSLDEIGPAEHGVLTDAEDADHRDVRVHALWAHLMAGGAGVEWYFGYKHPHNDLNAEDWRSRERMWDQTRVALEFFHRHVPVGEAAPLDGVVADADGWCLGVPDRLYVVYLPSAGAATIDLAAATGRFRVRWFDPRRGGDLRSGSVAHVESGGRAAIGAPPSDPSADWVVLLDRAER
jgi:hypothetical protein